MDPKTLSFPEFASRRLHGDRERLTREWVEKISTRLDLPPRRVLPTRELLDHIPEVLSRAAQFLVAPDVDTLAAESIVTEEMRGIVHLRRRQGYEMHEILREFDELARILDAAALRWIDEYPGDPDAKRVGEVFGRLNRVPLLMSEITVRILDGERRDLLRQLGNVQEQERRRLSRELHDQLGQLLTGLLLGLRSLERVADPHERSARIRELEALAGLAVRGVQDLALELRPPALESLGLEQALRHHIEEWAERNGIEADFESIGLDGARLPAEIEIALFRVAQEGLTNVLKHAAASRVGVLLERRRGTAGIIVEDDGDGFEVDPVLSAPEKSRSLGLRGMRERVALLGGTLHLESSPGGGTTLFVRIPDPAGASSPPGAGSG